MILDNDLLFEDKHNITINNTENELYYFFDYDHRNANINMDFQHFHPFFELLILLAPEADFLFEGKSYHMTMGDIMLIPPYVLHKSIYKEGTPSKRLLINFMYPSHLFGQSDGYRQLLSPFFNNSHIFRFTKSQKNTLYTSLNDILIYSLSEEFTSSLGEIIIHAKFINFLGLLLKYVPNNIYINNSFADQKIYDISSYIHNNYQESLTLDFLAEKFYISPYYLSRQFKKVTSFTLSSYIQNTRIKNAQHQLLTTNNKITDIAENCGFSSFSQFNRTFQKLNNVSPREYRKIASLPPSIN